jgi:hypothetical protein
MMVVVVVSSDGDFRPIVVVVVLDSFEQGVEVKASARCPSNGANGG